MKIDEVIKILQEMDSKKPTKGYWKGKWHITEERTEALSSAIELMEDTIMKLSKEFITELQKYPESGMGYQKVNIELLNGNIITGLVVLNGEELIMPKTFINQISKITVKGGEKND